MVQKQHSPGSSAEERRQRGAAMQTAAEKGKEGVMQGEHYEDTPLDYHRNDWDLRNDVFEALKADIDLAPEPIDVEVNDGVVVLSGLLATEELKDKAEKTAFSILDVKEVKNRIQIA